MTLSWYLWEKIDQIILKVGYETSYNLVELIETHKNLEEEFEGTFEQDELVNIKNLCIFIFAITVPENVDGCGNWLPTSFTIQSKVNMASDAMSPSRMLRTSTKATCSELHAFSFSYVMNCKEGGTFENLNFRESWVSIKVSQCCNILLELVSILDVSCDNSPAKHFEIGFLHWFGGWHLIWAQCDQQTFMGSPKKEALLLIITSTRVSSYQPPIMVMPLSTLFV